MSGWPHENDVSKLDITTERCILTRKPNARVSALSQEVLVRSEFHAKSAKGLAGTSGGVPSSCAPPASVRSTLPVSDVNVATSSVKRTKKTRSLGMEYSPSSVGQSFISGVVVG